MKQVDRLVLKGFLGPYIMSFFVTEFVLVMQFLWKHIDDIIGKGFSLYMLLELIFYYALTIIPLAVPVTVLIASVMVFGNMSERYELSSLKSAGISLTRIMKGGIAIAIFTALFSLFSSNFLKPKANYKFTQRFYQIRKQKPTLSIEEGIFNKDFKNYIIRVGNKLPNGKSIEDILIYDHTGTNPEEINVILAKRGEMYTTEDGKYFVMNLFEGEQYRDLKKKVLNKKEREEGKKEGSKYPFLRTKFKEWMKVFDMSEFEISDNSPNLGRNKKDLMNTPQILFAIDSLNKKIAKTARENNYRFDYMFDSLEVASQKSRLEKNKNYDKYKSNVEIATNAKISSKIKKNTTRKGKTLAAANTAKYRKKILLRQNPDSLDFSKLNGLLNTFSEGDQLKLVTGALASAKSTKDRVNSIILKNNNYRHTKSRYILKLNQQYSWALVCIIFVFIGAPLGSIIRKGGYGYPLLIAIIFFMIFIILQIMGDKLNRSDKLDPLLGAWLPCLVLLPVAVFLTYKALNDSKIFNISFYVNKLINRFQKFKSE